MNRLRLPLLLAGLLAGLAPICALRGFVFIEEVPAWPDGTVTLELQLGSSPTYSDGTTPNSTAIQALQSWNPSMSRVQLGYVNNSSATKSRTNGKNNVFFAANIFGSPFGDGVLAVTVGRATASAPIELDVVVNNRETWDSYRGPLQYNRMDLRRILAHEFGHVLGLDHPDEYGQGVRALMNAYVSDIDGVQQDDKDGVSARYGRGPGNPAEPPEIIVHPYSATITEGTQYSLSGVAYSPDPIRYQWLKNGVAIAGATENALLFQPVRLSDAGVYRVRFTNDGGSVTSNEATLTVIPATPPVIQGNPPATYSVEEGGTLSLSGWATSNTDITYQWTRNGENIPGATYSSLFLDNATQAQAGTYRLVATTIAGTATSTGCVVTVIPAQPPVITYHPSNATVILGQYVSFNSSASSVSPASIQWSHNGTDIPGATYPGFSISSVTAADAGTYRITYTNIAGSVTSNPAVLTVAPLPPPPAMTLPNTTIVVGSYLSLDIYAYGESAGTTYQWYKDGAAIPGATGSSFTVYSVTLAHAGEYFVVATNNSASTTSTTALVTVTDVDAVPIGGWRQAVNAGGVAYFLFENPARIEQFDLATESWLGPIQLPRVPAAMAITEDATPIVAFYRTISRINPTSGAETPLVTLENDLWDMAVGGGRLYFITTGPYGGWGYRRLGSVDLTNPAAPQWSENSYYVGTGLSIDAGHAKAFTLSSGIYPADIASTVLNADGSFQSATDSPYAGDYETGSDTWLNPDATRIFDNSGVVYSTTDLTFAGSLGTRFNAITFQADGSPLVLRGTTVSAYDTTLRGRGILTLARAAQHIAVRGDSVFAFSQPSGSGASIAWDKRLLSDIAEPPPLDAVSASALRFSADDAFIDRDGVVVLYSKIHGNLFRWSTHEQRYLDPIPLHGRPNHVTYSPEAHKIYLGYANSRISVVDLVAGTDERFVATASQGILGMCAAGDHVMICDPTGALASYLTFGAEGTLAHSSEWRYFSQTYVWNANRRRVYHFRDDTSPNDLLYTEIASNGTIGTSKDSPYHGEINVQPPIRISPSGDIVLLGTGKFYNADTLIQNNELANGLQDAAWVGTRLVTARDVLGAAQLQRWGGSNYGLDATCELDGRIVRLFACGSDRLLAVTQKVGRTHFTLLDADLNIRNHFEDTPDLTRTSLANLSTRAEVGTGDDIIIAGFVVTGDGPKRVLVRGVGPGLDRFRVAGTLADPVLTLVGDAGTLAENDNWFTSDGEALKLAFRQAYAFGLAEDSLDSALIATLPPGKYTALVRGKDGGTGVALVEAYDLDAVAGARRFVNISTRAVVGVGDKVLIPGLIVDGTAPKRLLIRAVGPELTHFGVSGVLADPILEVVNADNEVVALNDNWGDDNTEVITAATDAISAFRLTEGGRDAALVVTLPPGSYTVVVRGVDDTRGVALVEVYEVP